MSLWLIRGLGQIRIAMGSHHHQVAILVLDDKMDCFGQLENFFVRSKIV